MSVESAKAFRQKMKSDSGFRGKVRGTKDASAGRKLLQIESRRKDGAAS